MITVRVRAFNSAFKELAPAFFAGSFDPWHRGHTKVTEKALRTYEHITIGVGVNPDKKYTFTIDERIDMICRSLNVKRNDLRIKVVAFSGLTIHYAFEHNIEVR